MFPPETSRELATLLDQAQERAREPEEYQAVTEAREDVVSVDQADVSTIDKLKPETQELLGL